MSCAHMKVVWRGQGHWLSWDGMGTAVVILVLNVSRALLFSLDYHNHMYTVIAGKSGLATLNFPGVNLEKLTCC